MSLTEIGKNVIINKKHRAGRFVEFTEAALQCLYIYIKSPQFAQFCAERMVGVCGILLSKGPIFCTQNKDISVVQLFVA